MSAPIDDAVFGPGWVAATEVVDDRAWLQAMLDVEVALAAAQERLGMVPAGVLPAIRSAARVEMLDLPGLRTGVRETANPVVALVSQLTEQVRRIRPAAADYVHRGSTSQDILDTAAMLLCARCLDSVAADLDRAAASLTELAAAHRDTVVAARTLTQHGVPTTFGLRAAGWLILVVEAADRVRRTRAALPASLGGAAGTLAAYEEYARLDGLPEGTSLNLAARFARELGLADHVLPWHALRIPVADVAAALGFTSGALGKIAADVLHLTATEVGELLEPDVAGRGSSSAMPQKQNPVLSTLIATAARQVPAQVSVLYQSMVVEHERSAGGWHAEWQPLREALRLVMGAASATADLTAGLRVNPVRMSENLTLTGGALVSERVTAVLASALGKSEAKRVLTAAVHGARESGVDLATVLADELAGTSTSMGTESIAELLRPEGYTGVAAALVDRAIAYAGGRTGGDGRSTACAVRAQSADPGSRTD